MAKRVAWCLVENDAGQVLLVQLGYSKEKYKWSLPGGHCESHESYSKAAARETREETGLRIDVVSLIRENSKHAHKTYFGRIRGGHLNAKRPECLDAKFFDYNDLPTLAYSANRRAIENWQDMKSTHARLTSNPLTSSCPNCGSDDTRLRRYPHHNPYRCRSCNRVFANEPFASPLGADKEVAISNIILNHILSERGRLGLPAPAPNTELVAAARDTAVWFASAEDFEDKIFDYLETRLRTHLAEKQGDSNVILFPALAYFRHVWPADTEPSEIAKDLIEKFGSSDVVNFPSLDYLAIGSCFAVLDQSGNSVDVTGGQPASFGYALVVAYATDGNSTIVDRINERREKVGVVPLQISVPLREMARKFITLSSADEAGDSLYDEAQTFGYATEGWRVRLHYSGCYAKFTSGSETSIAEPEMADVVATQLVKDWPILLRPDWQDIGIVTGVKNHTELGELNFQAEFVIGWRIPFDAERPAHFPSPIDRDGNPSNQETLPKPQRRRGWWPFRS